MKKYLFFITFAFFINGVVAQTINYNYDSLGRLTHVIYPDSSIVKYAYDATGNRFSKRVIQSPIIRACPQSNISFFAGTNDNTNTYQWQVNNFNGFENITPDVIYSGVNSATLILNNAPSNWYNYKYRCLISGTNSQSTSQVFTLKFAVTWIGGSDTAWENSANWSCGSTPDGNTDVVINSAVTRYPEVNSNVFCRSIIVQPGATILVKPGYRIDLTGQ